MNLHPHPIPAHREAAESEAVTRVRALWPGRTSDLDDVLERMTATELAAVVQGCAYLAAVADAGGTDAAPRLSADLHADASVLALNELVRRVG